MVVRLTITKITYGNELHQDMEADIRQIVLRHMENTHQVDDMTLDVKETERADIAEDGPRGS